MDMNERYRATFGGGAHDKDAAWEGTSVRHLLSTLGIGRKAVTSITGGVKTFADFRQAFPDFPYYVRACRIKHPDDFMAELMRMHVTGSRRVYAFFRSTFYDEFSSTVDEARSVGSVKYPALVFYHPVYQSMVLHTWNYERSSGVRIIIRKDEEHADPIILEPFRQWAYNLLSSGRWSFNREMIEGLSTIE